MCTSGSITAMSIDKPHFNTFFLNFYGLDYAHLRIDSLNDLTSSSRSRSREALPADRVEIRNHYLVLWSPKKQSLCQCGRPTAHSGSQLH